MVDSCIKISIYIYTEHSIPLCLTGSSYFCLLNHFSNFVLFLIKFKINDYFFFLHLPQASLSVVNQILWTRMKKKSRMRGEENVHDNATVQIICEF